MDNAVHRGRPAPKSYSRAPPRRPGTDQQPRAECPPSRRPPRGRPDRQFLGDGPARLLFADETILPSMTESRLRRTWANVLRTITPRSGEAAWPVSRGARGAPVSQRNHLDILPSDYRDRNGLATVNSRDSCSRGCAKHLTETTGAVSARSSAAITDNPELPATPEPRRGPAS